MVDSALCSQVPSTMCDIGVKFVRSDSTWKPDVADDRENTLWCFKAGHFASAEKELRRYKAKVGIYKFYRMIAYAEKGLCHIPPLSLRCPDRNGLQRQKKIQGLWGRLLRPLYFLPLDKGTAALWWLWKHMKNGSIYYWVSPFSIRSKCNFCISLSLERKSVFLTIKCFGKQYCMGSINAGTVFELDAQAASLTQSGRSF